MFIIKGLTGKTGRASHRETCLGQTAPRVPMRCLATAMEFLCPAIERYLVSDENNHLQRRLAIIVIHAIYSEVLTVPMNFQ